MAVTTSTSVCPDCGTSLRDSDRYCPTCDAPNRGHRFPKFRPRVTDLPNTAPEEPWRRPALRSFTCPRCEATVEPGSWLCAGCGLDVAKLLAEPSREPLDGVWPIPGPGSTPEYRPLRSWTGPWRLTLWLAALLSLALTSLLTGVLVLGLDATEMLPFQADLSRLGSIGTIMLSAFVASLVVMLLVAIGWTNRAYRNIEALGARRFRISPDLVAAAWFVPVVNLFVPVVAMRDVWRASDPRLPHRCETWHANKVQVPITESWIMSMVGGVAIVVGWWGMGPVAGWNEEIIASSLATAALGHLLVAIGLLQLASVAESVTERQRTRANRIGPPEALVRLGVVPGQDERSGTLVEDAVAQRPFPRGARVYGRY